MADMLLLRPVISSCAVILSLASILLAKDTPQTVNSLAPYAQLRECAQNCFVGYQAGCIYDNVAKAINCPANCFSLALDSCFCRADVQTDAESYLSSCVITSCSSGGNNKVDLSSAVSIYDSYCLEKGYTALRAPASTEASPTPNTEIGSGAPTVPTSMTVQNSGATTTDASNPTPTNDPTTPTDIVTATEFNTISGVTKSSGSTREFLLLSLLFLCWQLFSYA